MEFTNSKPLLTQRDDHQRIMPNQLSSAQNYKIRISQKANYQFSVYYPESHKQLRALKSITTLFGAIPELWLITLQASWVEFTNSKPLLTQRDDHQRIMPNQLSNAQNYKIRISQKANYQFSVYYPESHKQLRPLKSITTLFGAIPELWIYLGEQGVE